MDATPHTGFEETSRANARACAQAGLALLAQAFNHCDRADLAHRYADAEQSRFHALAVELVELVEHGTIEANPAHAQNLRAQAARSDSALQAVFRRASRKTPIQSR